MYYNRKAWFSFYVAAWLIVVAVAVVDLPFWAFAAVSSVWISFVVFTDPKPRKGATVKAGCGCPKCERMRVNEAAKQKAG